MTDMIATPVKPSSASWYLANWLAPLKNLYVQVLVAVALGILLGVVYPGVAVDLKPLSDAFITLLRAVVPADRLCHRRDLEMDGRTRQ
jgi:hypothetical protein